jgi:hypothetical protein
LPRQQLGVEPAVVRVVYDGHGEDPAVGPDTSPDQALDGDDETNRGGRQRYRRTGSRTSSPDDGEP